MRSVFALCLHYLNITSSLTVTYTRLNNFVLQMSGRSVLPPSVLPEGAAKETLDVLQGRLTAAESDTKQLVDQLAGMGFAYDDKVNI